MNKYAIAAAVIGIAGIAYYYNKKKKVSSTATPATKTPAVLDGEKAPSGFAAANVTDAKNIRYQIADGSLDGSKFF